MSSSSLRLACAAVLLLAACGDNEAPNDPGSDAGGDAAASSLRIVPAAAQLRVGGAVRFRAEALDGTPVEATFTVTGGGAIAADGRYVAPRTPATVTIEARAGDDTGQATVDVAAYRGALTELPMMHGPRFSHSATLLADGSVLLVGSSRDGVVERFVPATATFVTAGDLGGPRWDHRAVRLADDSVLIVAGRNGPSALATAARYHDGAFTSTAAPLAEARFQFGVALLASGKVLVTGGQPRPGGDVVALASAELYDPATDRFTATGALGSTRSGHTTTVLRDGRVLVIGGRDSSCVLGCAPRFWATAELYDPETGMFTPTGSMAIERADHTATLLDDGRVLVAGGLSPGAGDSDIADTLESYDPATGMFSPAGTLQKRRTEHTATVLGDGRILFAHGRTEGEGTLASSWVETLDLTSGARTMAEASRSTRYRHTATLLDDATVLVTGGSEGGVGGIASVDRYE
ncbi:MAG TPA: kelch repeat-containing protein [Kofleriaceae bacterium]|nr:kelch repeat-containing protein [Kofleriaceae bacterium]